jgi:uncharacterized SAM-binding protein YcdF (DUF218 family)
MFLRSIQRILLFGVLGLAGGAARAEEGTPPANIPIATAQTLSTSDWLGALAGLDYSEEDFKRGISDGTLSTLYVQLAAERQTLRTLQTLVARRRPVMLAAQNVDKILAAIREFYADYIHEPWLGDERAYQSPDIIVILGAGPSALSQRLDHALPIIQRFEKVPVVLSGGGRTITLEAQAMHDYLKNNGVAEDRLIMEPDSLDTVGNAVFTGFTLAKKNIRSGKILLVTSDFHAPRALFLFQSILGSRFRVAVSPTPSVTEDLPARIEAELQEEALAVRDLLHWPPIGGAPPRRVKGLCDVFYQLLLRHKLYEARWDLARRYADQCKLSR